MGDDRDRGDERNDATRKLLYALGAAGGVAIGVALSRAVAGVAGTDAAERIRRGAGRIPARLSPGRLRRGARERDEQLALEDAVLNACLDDEVLAGRGIDVGAVSPGIIELSGAVFTRAEAQRAVEVAQRVPGVETVINRMDVEDERARMRPRDAGEGEEMSGHAWTGQGSGMGRRRQGRETDPGRPDDSQSQRERSLEQADRSQFEDEYTHSRPRMAARPEVQEARRGGYDEDELDNQDPYGKHAVPAPEQPQALNAAARVGEGLKPATELDLEGADLPVKPHGRGGERGNG